MGRRRAAEKLIQRIYGQNGPGHADMSLRSYAREAWRVVEPTRDILWGWHLDALADHLEAVGYGHIQYLLITIAPRSGKSLFDAVFFPTWLWTWKPETQFLYSSYDYKLSLRDANRSRRLIESDWYQARWGSVFAFIPGENQSQRYNNTLGGHRIATSIDGAVTGEGGDVLVLDDPHNVRKGRSLADLEAKRIWFDESWTQRRNDRAKSAMVVTQQRVNQRDVAGHILSEHAGLGWVELRLPTRYVPGRHTVTVKLKPEDEKPWEDPRAVQGELIAPERMNEEMAQREEILMGGYGWSSQHQQEPTPPTGGIFKRYWFRYWSYPGQPMPPVVVAQEDGTLKEVYAEELPATFDTETQSWDFAFKDLEDSSYVVGQVWGKHGANSYLRAMERGHLDFVKSVQAIQAVSQQWPRSQAKLVEDKANGTAIISTVKNHIPGILPVNPEGTKDARAAATTWVVQAANIYLPHPDLYPWVDLFLDEVCGFKAGAAHDDITDAFTQYLRHAYPTEVYAAGMVPIRGF